MKKLIILLSVLAIPFLCFSQEHMKFMGVEINGSAFSFGQKLSERDFEKVFGVKNAYTGEFSGHNCTVFYNCTPQTRQVYSVVVAFDHDFDEDVITNLVERYLTKYGKTDPVTGTYTNYETDEVGFTIHADNGDIRIEYVTEKPNQYNPSGRHYWSIFYFDAQNLEKCMNEQYSDL